MSLNDDRPCTNCQSLEHRLCGTCSRCHEHAIFNVPEGDDPITGEILSECCSAYPVPNEAPNWYDGLRDYV